MFDLTNDQELLHQTTKRFLDSESAPARLRDLAGTKAGYEPDYWRRGAALGWTSLVVPEAAGGGSVSGAGVADLTLIAHEFGHHAAPGPLGPVNLVAAALGRWGTDAQKDEYLPGLLAGELVGAWAWAEAGPFGHIGLEAGASGGTVTVSGTKTPVEAGHQADLLLVTARRGHQVVLLVVPPDAPGVAVTPLDGVDLTRRHAQVAFDQVPVGPDQVLGTAGEEEADWLLDLAVVVQLAEMVGAMRWALDTTLEWCFNRYSFGRPLASYQEIKHRMADMKTWLEASYAITAQAAQALDENQPERKELVSAGKLYVGRHGIELMHDCVQLHGGIGVTFDHDLHLFLRRLTTNLALYGSPTDHAVRIGRILHAEVSA